MNHPSLTVEGLAALLRPPVIIPAAGVGTRLSPLTEAHPKELLPLGGRPLLWGSFSEVARAACPQVVVVTSAEKPELNDWLGAQVGRWPFDLHSVDQPEPLGVLDAVARARGRLGDIPRWVVLFPDFVHLPDQGALAQLLDAADRVEGTTCGLVEITGTNADRLGRTGRARGAERGDGLIAIDRLEGPQPPVPGALHTAFADVQDTHFATALASAQRSGYQDAAHFHALDALATGGRLFGQILGGAILDVGTLAGYEHAVGLFERGEATWREAR